MVNKTD